MPVNSEIFRIYRHLFYGSPLKTKDNMLIGVYPLSNEF